MSETMIDNWLDDDIDETRMEQFEEWLREDSDRIQSFFDGVQLQEDLRLHFGVVPTTVTLTSRTSKRMRLIGWLSAAAVLLVAVLLIMPHESEPQPTADPLVWVLDGDPRVEIIRIEPGPNPFPIPHEEWPVETQITISDGVGTLRWGEDCELRGDAGTNFALRSERDGSAQNEIRSIRLNSGSLTVNLAQPAVAIDALVGGSRVRAPQPAVFTIRVFESDSVLSVVSGNVELQLPDGEKRTIESGEQVSLP